MHMKDSAGFIARNVSIMKHHASKLGLADHKVNTPVRDRWGAPALLCARRRRHLVPAGIMLTGQVRKLGSSQGRPIECPCLDFHGAVSSFDDHDEELIAECSRVHVSTSMLL
jgi:hypothetical protein